jgi:hypothetical protein
MNLRQIHFNPTDHQAGLWLRQWALRAHLGCNLADKNLDAEGGQRCYVLFDDDGTLLACVISPPLSPVMVEQR